MSPMKTAAALVLCLALAPGATAGEPVATPQTAVVPTVLPASILCTGPGNLSPAPQTPISLAVTGTCSATADCWDGSHVTCTASGTSENCSFTDSSCPGQRGYCWSSDEGFKYCPACPCSAPPCSEIDGGSCSKPGTYSRTCQLGSNCNFRCICSSSGTYLCP